jgi:hypothetical protein
MKDQHYHFKDFMMDESFQPWALESDAQPDNFWPTWILLHPDKEKEIHQARKAIVEIYLTGARKEVVLLAPALRPEMEPARGDKAAIWTHISQAC